MRKSLLQRKHELIINSFKKQKHRFLKWFYIILDQTKLLCGSLEITLEVPFKYYKSNKQFFWLTIMAWGFNRLIKYSTFRLIPLSGWNQFIIFNDEFSCSLILQTAEKNKENFQNWTLFRIENDDIFYLDRILLKSVMSLISHLSFPQPILVTRY